MPTWGVRRCQRITIGIGILRAILVVVVVMVLLVLLLTLAADVDGGVAQHLSVAAVSVAAVVSEL
jgi:sensor histidine kinase regulating citrate/malate metabolism